VDSINVNNSEYCVGNTPLVLVQSLTKSLGFHVWAKLEGSNPGQSIKDRIVTFMLDRAELKGDLVRGKGTIVEASSGNTGHSLAMVAANRGYKAIIVVKDNCTKEKIFFIKLLGAEVVVCPSGLPSDHPDSYYEKAKSIAASIEDGYYLNQNFNEMNYLAHYKCLGPEIISQMGDNSIDYVFASCSTGGTLSGVGRAMKAHNKAVKVIGADSLGSSLSVEFYNKGEVNKKTIISGLGKDIIPSNFKKEYIDEMIAVDDQRCIQHIHNLAKYDGIIAGGSSGATVDALKQMAHKIPKDSNVILIFADHGSKYMSTYFNQDWLDKKLKKITTIRTFSQR
jgi:cystathionine beta-synthase